MAKLAPSPAADSLYDTDFHLWSQQQARLLRERRWDDLDVDNLVDEVESVGRSEKREIESRLEILIAHLLKWKYQPGGRSGAWRATIAEQRSRIARIVKDSPSLRRFASHQVALEYEAGRLLASRETGIAFGLFPDECPFSANDVLDPHFWPEDRTIE